MSSSWCLFLFASICDVEGTHKHIHRESLLNLCVSRTCVCVYTHIHTYIRTYITSRHPTKTRIFILAYTHDKHTHRYIHRTHTNIHAYIRMNRPKSLPDLNMAQTHTYICICVCVCVCVNLQKTHVHTCTVQVYIHCTHMHGTGRRVSAIFARIQPHFTLSRESTAATSFQGRLHIRSIGQNQGVKSTSRRGTHAYIKQQK